MKKFFSKNWYKLIPCALLFFFIITMPKSGLSQNKSIEKDSVKRYFNATEVGASFQFTRLKAAHDNYVESPEKNVLISFTTVNGYRFNHWATLGAGIGFQFDPRQDVGNYSKSIPVFLDARFAPIKDNISPLFVFQGGVNLLLDKERPVTPFCALHLGLTNKNTKKIKVHLLMGYQFFTFFGIYKTYVGGAPPTSVDLAWAHFASIKFGVNF